MMHCVVYVAYRYDTQIRYIDMMHTKQNAHVRTEKNIDVGCEQERADEYDKHRDQRNGTGISM